MSFNFNTAGLLENVSNYLENETSRFETVIQKMESDHNEKLSKLEKAHQTELDKLIKSHSDEINHLEANVSLLTQAQDLNKFQKKTITALKNELAEMQATIITLEKRLACAEGEVMTFKADSKSMKEAPVKDTPPEPVNETENSEYTPDLYPITLKSGVYYCDSSSNELYEFISAEEAGEVVSILKTVKIKSNIYYLDTKDNNFYSKNEDNTVGDHAGQVLDKKAVFKTLKI